MTGEQEVLKELDEEQLNGPLLMQQGLKLTNGDRQNTHGDWVENHERIAEYWSTHLKKRITGSDVCKMLTMMKFARDESGSLNADDFRDASVYAARAYDCRLAEVAEDSRDVVGEYTRAVYERAVSERNDAELEYIFDRPAAK